MSNRISELRTLTIDALRCRAGHTAFVAELSVALTGQAQSDRVEDALAALEADGVVLVRPHFYGDPHLAGVDLRIAGLVDRGDAREGTDPIAVTLAAISRAWQTWLGEFLQNHRCG